jgi:hypothetical protein
MICALLVFQRPELPQPLAELSPWLDWLGTPRLEVHARLEAQTHQRFIKTHTPLDGIPIDRRATYIVAARHPLDAAVSLYHHGNNLSRKRIRELMGHPDDCARAQERPELRPWLRSWIDWTGDPREQMDSLAGVMWHLSDAWARRGQPNIVLVHYNDLANNLDGEMRRIARLLAIEVADDVWPELEQAATFDHMRSRADLLAPGPDDVLKNRAAFFRRGSVGAGRETLSPDELAKYYERTAQMAPPDLLAWLHRENPSAT